MISNAKKIYISLFAVVLLYSCATQSIQMDPEQVSVQNDNEYYSFYLTGNLGLNYDPQSKVLKALTTKIKETATPDDYLLILGDNVKANSLRKQDKDSKDLLQYKKQLELLASTAVNKRVIAGEHDWNDDGIGGLKKIEELTEDILGDNEVFQPENACPIEEIEITESIQLIMVDSQWYVEDWNENIAMNDDCEIRTRQKFLKVLEDAIRKSRHKTILLAMHHPLYSNGVHGGALGARMLFTPMQENAYLPIVGFMYSLVRSQAGFFPQDRYNPLMNQLMEAVETMGQGVQKMIVVSAHEENMQYIDQGSIKQLVSGTSTSRNIAALGKRGKFSAGLNGFVELRVYQDESSQAIFYTVDEDGSINKVYDNQLFEARKSYSLDSLPAVTAQFENASVYPTSETVVTDKYERFYGTHYRELYGIKVKAPVVLLDTLYGGLTVQRAGGGNQTQGLRLTDSLGRAFNMRALEKDALQFLKSAGYNKLNAQAYFSETLPEKIIRDFYTAAHPFGAFAIPKLAGAIDVNHTHPRLFYVPKQATLGDFNRDHGDRLYMIVEKPDESFQNKHLFGDNEDVESTEDLFEKLRSDESYILDEEMYIRARIFDMLLGDWDRHEDQWRWAQIDDANGVHRFEAIPRDRDQVFARFDGMLLKNLSFMIGGIKQLGVYGPDIEYVTDFNRSAIHLDRALLQRTTLESWLTQVDLIQEKLTTQIVRRAFNDMPSEVKNEQWEQTIKDFIERKANLESIIKRYYESFIKFQTLKGTDKDDLFIIERNDEQTSVTAYRIKDGIAADLLFDRDFKDGQTNDIWIYGLDDNDVFKVVGQGSSDISVVLVGGSGNDAYTVENSKRATIYDYKSEGNNLLQINDSRVVLRDDYTLNHYNHNKEPGKKIAFALNQAYNPDEGMVGQMGIEQWNIGYDRNPFTSRYGLDLEYIPLTQAAVATAFYERAHVLGHWNGRLQAGITSNNFTQNFFGYGNDSFYNANTSFDANRIFMQQQTASLSIYKNGKYGSDFKFGFNYLGVEVEPDIPSPTRVNQLREDYVAWTAGYEFNSYDNARFSTRGMSIKGDFSYTDNLRSSQSFLSFDPSLSVWNGLDTNRRLVLKSTIAAQIRMGDDPLFYQSARLGADYGLRSYRQDRFVGNQALRASFDLKYDVKPIRTKLLPLRLVPYLGLDAGRVWFRPGESNTIHTSYGGGFSLSFPGIIQTRFSYFHGQDGGRFSFGIYFSA